MSSESPVVEPGLRLSGDERIDGVCRRYESAWKSGLRPSIGDYLGDSGGTERTALFRELLHLDLHYRRRAGENPPRHEYERNFPKSVAVIDAVFHDFLQSVSNRSERGASGSPQFETSPFRPPHSAADADTGEHSASVATHDANGPAVVSSSPHPGQGDNSQSVPPKSAGRYKVIRRCGAGSFGQVYLAHDDSLDRDVAIKVPHPRLQDSQQAQDAFLNEARRVAQLQHEGIVRALDFGKESHGLCYLVYEYVEGETLEDRIRHERMQQEPLSNEAIAEVIAQIADALHYAHLHGLVHRDIKPANILLDRHGTPKIADFGLAVREDELVQQRGRLAGTLPYMSPEQWRLEGHLIDGRTDIYGLGVVLYETLCGRRPFQAATMQELEEQVLHREPRPPRQICESVPRELERVCLKALSKSVAGRYLTAKDMADALRAAVRPPKAKPEVSRRHAVASAEKQLDHASGPARTVSVPPSAPFGQPASKQRNRRLPAMTASVLGASALIGLIVILVRTPPDDVSKTVSPAAGEVVEKPLAPEPTGTLELRAKSSDVETYLQKNPAIATSVQKPTDHHSLNIGNNPLPPGDYSLNGTGIRFSSSTITIKANGNTIVAVESAYKPMFSSNWQYPQIPTRNGAWVRYHGKMWHSGLSSKEPILYHVTLQALESETIDGTTFRWIEIESRVGDYKEVGRLLIDEESYRNRQRLEIKRGWLWASVSAAERKDEFEIAVEFDPKRDSLREVAEQLNRSLPVDRLSVRELLVLFFNADVSASKIIQGVRAALGTNTREPSPDELTGPEGKIACQVIRSGPGPGSKESGSSGYELWHNETEVPFNLARFKAEVHAAGNAIFNVSLELDSYRGDSAKTLLPPESVLKELAEKRELLSTGQSLIFASLPDEVGAWVRYNGYIQRGPKAAKIEFRVTVRSLDEEQVGGIHGRWIEIAIDSGDSRTGLDPKRREIAKILIDEDLYRGEERRFKILRGWSQYQNNTFSLDPSGDEAEIRDALASLKTKLPEPADRFSFHEVLTLMFGVNLKESKWLSDLRGKIAVFLTAKGLDRTVTRGQFTLPSGEKLAVNELRVAIPSTAKTAQPVSYTLKQSDEVPFAWVEVDLHVHESIDLDLVVTVEDRGKKTKAEMLDEASLRTLAEQTQKLVAEARQRTADEKKQNTPRGKSK